MTESISQTSGTQSLRPRARILRTLGDELISSEMVAVIELVKNSYDADATRVLVRFIESEVASKNRIEVVDNGHGMSLQTVQTAWMEPATLMRKRNKRSEKRGRRVLGQKGIGRFAASRLADFLEVVTRRPHADQEVRVFFDWSQFDDEEKYLDEVEVLWEEADPVEICPDGVTRALWEEGEKPTIDDLSHGTILRMEGTRTEWGREQFTSLRTGLSRLISPFFGKDDRSEGDEFRICLEVFTQFESLSGVVEPPEALGRPHYWLKGQVDEHGHYDVRLRLQNQDVEEPISKQYTFKDGHKPECGPFSIELRAWDRDRDSLGELAQLYGSTLTDVRRDLNNAAGINIYRDGFRVLPYGEPRNDWLRLDLRRVQNPTLRLSNNQIVGFILISADSNPLLRDQSNREGLIEGQALDDLRTLVEAVLSEVETRRYAVRPRRESPSSQTREGLFAGFDLISVRQLLAERYPDDSELLALIGEKEKDLGTRVERVQEVLGRYRRLATLGQLIDTVLHDGRAPLAKIKNESDLGLRDIRRASTASTEILRRLDQRLHSIGTQSDVLGTVFRKIEPFGGRKRGRPTEIHLEKVISDAFSVLETEIAEVGARTVLPESLTSVTVDQSEIQQVIINLLQNSLYWLRESSRENREISVKVVRTGPESVEILFSDSGPGVDPEFQKRIFEPYFSTKPDGVGLGLTIAGEIVSEYYAGTLELLDGGPLPGATFRITLRRRV